MPGSCGATGRRRQFHRNRECRAARELSRKTAAQSSCRLGPCGLWPEATRGCPILLASVGQPVEHQVAWCQENEQACFQGEVPSRRGRCLQNRHFWHRCREVRFCAGPVPNTSGIQADVGVSVSPGARERAMPAFPDGCGTCNCSGISSCAGLTQARNGYCGPPDNLVQVVHQFTVRTGGHSVAHRRVSARRTQKLEDPRSGAHARTPGQRACRFANRSGVSSAAWPVFSHHASGSVSGIACCRFQGAPVDYSHPKITFRNPSRRRRPPANPRGHTTLSAIECITE